MLITAHSSYYDIDRVPEFWERLAHVCSEEHAKVPIELYEEITDGNDALADWPRDSDNRSALLLEEAVESGLVSRVVDQGYAPDLTDDELEKWPGSIPDRRRVGRWGSALRRDHRGVQAETDSGQPTYP